MRYKGDYKPQHVLDYDTGQWDVLDDEMRRLMDKRKWVSMSRERRLQEESDGADEESKALETYAVEHPKPTAAMEAELSLLDLHVPGTMTLEQLRRQVNLDNMKVTLGGGEIHKMQEIVSWADGKENDPTSIKGIMAELAACIGPNLARELVVDLGR